MYFLHVPYVHAVDMVFTGQKKFNVNYHKVVTFKSAQTYITI